MPEKRHMSWSSRYKVHFTVAGYSLIGDLLFNALMDRYMEHLNHKAR